LRGTYGIPGVIAEASFFTNPDEEARLKEYRHNKNEAMAHLVALEAFFEKTAPSIEERYSIGTIFIFKIQYINRNIGLIFSKLVPGELLTEINGRAKRLYKTFGHHWNGNRTGSRSFQTVDAKIIR